MAGNILLSDYDPCGRCGCYRMAHRPDKTYLVWRAYRNQGPNQPPMIPVIARTCCDKCQFCMCFCPAFIEPTESGPTCCKYEFAGILAWL